MYIHRVAIDTNCINAKQQLTAMNALEALHKSNLIEIVRTSTMNADLQKTTGLRAVKASQYQAIGAGRTSYLTGQPSQQFPDAAPGTILRDSKFIEIYESMFGADSGGKRRGPPLRDHHMRSIRDALHVDQCWQNMVDFFITNEKRLQNCTDLDFTICNPETCLTQILEYFGNAFGTTNIGELENRMIEVGPIILGSNSIASFECKLADDDPPLLRVEVSRNEVAISCNIRDGAGKSLLKIRPAAEWEWPAPQRDCNVFFAAGPSPLKLGTKECKNFSIVLEGHPLLAGRLVKPGRLVLFEALLRDPNGEPVFIIHRDSLELRACPLALL
jgi:hypothetical protein